MDIVRYTVENCGFSGFNKPCTSFHTMLTDRGVCGSYNGRSIKVDISLIEVCIQLVQLQVFSWGKCIISDFVKSKLNRT